MVRHITKFALAFAIVAAATLPSNRPALADKTAIKVDTSARSFSRFFGPDNLGKLTFVGGLTLQSEHKDFGGFSGLEVSPDGKSFLSVSDRGNWLSGKLLYKNGKLTGLANAELAPIRNSKGKVHKSKSRVDAEAVAAWNKKGLNGRVIVGFERRERVEQFNIAKQGFKARARLIKSPKALSDGQRNGELEAVGRFFEGPLKGQLIAISERNQAKDDSLRGWLWRKGKTHEFQIPQHKDFRITGLAILPGGKEIVTVERSFTPPVLVGMTIRKFSVAQLQKRKTGKGEVLFEGMLTNYLIDNMEGIAAHKDDRGTVLTVISDDNFNTSVQSTVMFQFLLNEK